MALSVTGTEYLRLANPVSAAPFTLACWALFTNFSANRACLSLTNTATSHRCVLYGQSSFGTAFFFVNDSGGFSQAQATATMSAGVWYHFVGVEHGTSRQVYLNGVGGTVVTATKSPSGLNALVIGADLTGGSVSIPDSGRIADVGVWSAALSASEIAALAAGHSPKHIRPQSLAAYLPLVRDFNCPEGGFAVTAVNSPSVGVHPRVFS